jgi:hypothetical protein
MTDDYAAFREDKPNDNLMAVLKSLADELEQADAEVVAAENALEEAKNKRKDIAENRIPQATDGMEGKFNLGDGRELQVKEEIRASIAGEKRVPAIQWMDNNGYGHIVKRQVIFEFPKGDEERYEKFMEAIKAVDVPNLVMKPNFTVHPATLVSWVKEQLGEGVDLPADTFGIFRQRTAKIKEY